MVLHGRCCRHVNSVHFHAVLVSRGIYRVPFRPGTDYINMSHAVLPGITNDFPGNRMFLNFFWCLKCFLTTATFYTSHHRLASCVYYVWF